MFWSLELWNNAELSLPNQQCSALCEVQTALMTCVGENKFISLNIMIEILEVTSKQLHNFTVLIKVRLKLRNTFGSFHKKSL